MYMGLGWLVASVGMFFLAVTETPSIAFLSFMTLTYAFGFWFGKQRLQILFACILCTTAICSLFNKRVQ